MPPAAELLQSISVDPSAGVETQTSVTKSLAQEIPTTKPLLGKVPSAVSALDVSFSFNSSSSAEVALSLPDTAIPSVGPRRPDTWQVEASDLSLRTVNPIRKITDAAGPSTNQRPPTKPVISLGQGDPTVFGHLSIASEATEAVKDVVMSGKFNGYSPSFGLPSARKALAKHLSSKSGPHSQYTPDDVYITSGCGHSFQLCLEALSNPGKNVLLPRPGFPVYDCWCAAAGLEIRRYRLVPERDWEVDLEEVEQLADENTVALLLCQPGNPCGNVFSKEHLRDVLSLAEKLKLPIISDEIYAGITFFGVEFTPTSAVAGEMSAQESDAFVGRDEQVRGMDKGVNGGGRVSRFSVPVLTVSSISKTLLVPGWRLGWIGVHDPEGILKNSKVIHALENRMQFTTPSCALIQAALPRILFGVKPDFFGGLNATLESALDLCLKRINSIPGIDCPSKPQGGMFLMVSINLPHFRAFSSDIEWCRALLQEESVVVIPGTAFEFSGWFRTLISAPDDILDEAWGRIEAFCHRYYNDV